MKGVKFMKKIIFKFTGEIIMERYMGSFLRCGVFIGLCLIFAVGQAAFANSAPVVSNVQANQRSDGSGFVDITYKLADADNDKCTIIMLVSSDGGSTWTVTPSAAAISGSIGSNISPGNRSILWNSKIDLPGGYGENYRVKITADDIISITWVYINDSGAGMKDSNGNPISMGGFKGYMSRYETTNAQYCQYLNSALSAGLIVVYNNIVYAASDTSHSQPYCDTYASSSYSQIVYYGGVFSVRTRDGYSMDNHPMVRVSWYGATAFAAYYGWRLPTEWEWQAAADYNGSYTYGCGTTISFSKANYYDNGYANPLGLTSRPYTSPVGYYGTFGYGLADMAGNVWEWTSSLYDPAYSYRVLRGGSWYDFVYYCTVSIRGFNSPYGMRDFSGFRVCR